ncbi:hypothetical protein Ddye_022534 [Dipteronia dyeriana]|uniref:Uncharacterized protein n=1 Tax=Dipteronia dyeriana TaxID=168575 RepID=A0AAD9WRJ3_9ROSI|nr:hypothetical protein Ddye_022534 [Dipteronia dyeriana]
MQFHVNPTYKRSLPNIPSLRTNPARMDSNGLTRFPSPRSNRFLLGTYPHLPPPPSADADLTEDDIFATDISEYNYHHHRHVVVHHQHNINKTNFSDNFGILAALPESSSHSHFYHKASMSMSSSSSSSSRTIPSIPKPMQERVAFMKYNQHQSAPVNVPMLTKAMKKNKHFEDEDVSGDMVVPPHEMVGRGQSPIVACSVLEGAGRTLKGRDLRQVRNAVWRQTVLLSLPRMTMIGSPCINQNGLCCLIQY